MIDPDKTAAREVFADALDLADARERERYLASACGHNHALRQEVESLLRAHLGAQSALPQAALQTVPLLAEEGPGSTIGRYRLLQEIGEGGFGVVYMAEQLEPVRRKVALKVIKAGMDTREVLARFEAERQALALMEHPNIASVFDGGAARSGRPYFVMELVKGIRITDYCDQHDLPTEARLRLFLGVCHAVQHAHQKGVIHRDLKPSNVLITEVDGEPVPKVIDFGVAKAIGQKLTEKTIFTRFERQIGTPVYMSPEQAGLGSVDVDTRSDIYTLGVLLYELLTGTTPLRTETLHTSAADEVWRLIREVEPPKPSTRLSQELTTAHLKLTSTTGRKPAQDEIEAASRRLLHVKETLRRVRGDLDWTAMKALDKDRRRRYQTAHDLAEDNERYLEHHPVVASPPGMIYWGRKFVRRHRTGVVLAMSVSAAMLFGLVLAAVGFLRATSERNRAVAASHEAEHRRQQAEDHRMRAEAALRRVDVEKAQALLAGDESAGALATLAFLLRQHPDDRVVAEWLMNLLTLRSFPLPATPPLRHDDGVSLGLFSPDGRHILTASRDNCARLWDVQTGQATAAFRHDPAALRAGDFTGGLIPLHAAFSPDGRLVATGSADYTARVWSVSTGQPLTPPLRHANWVTHVAFSPDGVWVATACKDGTARLWKAASGEAAGPALVHPRWVNLAKFSPDGTLLLTASDDAAARLWTVPGGALVATMRHLGIVKDAAFSPDGNRVVTASEDRTARLWDARDGAPIGSPLLHHSGLTWACFSPDGTKVATASFDQTARIWDGFDGRALGPPMEHAYSVRRVRFGPDGQRVVTCSQDATARVWDADSGKPLTEPMRHRGEVWSAEFSPDGRWVLTASSDNTAQVWDVLAGEATAPVFFADSALRAGSWAPDGSLVLVRPCRPGVHNAETGMPADLNNPSLSNLTNWLCAQFSPDGQRIVIGSQDHLAWVWDGRGSKALTRRMRHEGAVRYAEFSRDGRLVATASDDGTARVWEAKTGRPFGLPLAHSDRVVMARFSPDGAFVVTASADHTARVWKVADSRPLSPPLEHCGPVTCAEFSPDGQRVLTGSADFSARVWDAVSGAPTTPSLTHHAPIESAQFNRSGVWIATASKDRTARIWDARTGRPVTQPLIHRMEVNRATFSRDGTRVVTASGDNSAVVWDPQTGIPLSPPLRHDKNVEDAAFSPDGRGILTCGFDMKARIWPLVQVNATPPSWLPELAEAVAGQRLPSELTTEGVPAESFLALKARFGNSPPEDEHADWLRWFLADRASRTVSPYSPRLVSEIMKDRQTISWPRIPESLERSAQAICLAPTNGLGYAHKACALARIALTNPPAQLPAIAWLSERAIFLSPEHPLPWIARGLYLALADQTNAALQAFERGSHSFGTNALYWQAYADLLEHSGRPEEAYQAAGKSCELIWDQARLLWRHSELSAGHAQDWKARYREQFAIPPRPPDLSPQLIDLSDHLSSRLDEPLTLLDLTRQSLRPLPPGHATLAGTEFDVRGLVLLRSALLNADYPTQCVGIPIMQLCGRLHFLHATDVPEAEGNRVASYIVHYADGQSLEIPVLFGRDTGAFLLEEDPADSAQPLVAWRHTTPNALTLQLYKMTWANPRRGVAVESIDVLSQMTRAAPFLVAITAEP